MNEFGHYLELLALEDARALSDAELSELQRFPLIALPQTQRDTDDGLPAVPVRRDGWRRWLFAVRGHPASRWGKR